MERDIRLNALDGAFERRPRGCRFFIGFSLVRGKTAEDRRLLDLLDPVAEAAGYEIVRLRMRGGEARRTLQIMAEDDQGEMVVSDCARLSRAVSEVLDGADAVQGEYTLEVSSPGVDRPLTRLKDFVAYEGFEARIELDRLADNRKRFKGVLAGVEDENVLIDLDDEAETTLVPFPWIAEAKLVLTDALMQKGAVERAARLAAEEAAGAIQGSEGPPEGDPAAEPSNEEESV
jgi:ribosome maturation factor RimP